MADAMKLLPDIEAEGERIVRDTYKREGDFGYLWTDVVGAVQTAISEERARWLAASPPASEEAPAEGAVSDADILRDTVPADLLDAELARLNDFWGVRMEGSEHVYPSVRATESGAQKLASRLNALSSEGPRYVTVALRARTSEPGAVAWRVRWKPLERSQPGAWREPMSKRPKDEDFVGYEIQPLFDHPAPATADKLKVAKEALLHARYDLLAFACARGSEYEGTSESVTSEIDQALATLNEEG